MTALACTVILAGSTRVSRYPGVPICMLSIQTKPSPNATASGHRFSDSVPVAAIVEESIRTSAPQSDRSGLPSGFAGPPNGFVLSSTQALPAPNAIASSLAPRTGYWIVKLRTRMLGDRATTWLRL